MDFFGQLNGVERSYEDLDDLECSPVHAELTERMRKTLYAGRVETDGISLPLTDIVVELFENADQGHLGQLSRRHVANLTRRSHATECSLFLSMIYNRRLRESNPDYVTRVKPAELFLVSMMIATKFLYDEGEEEELYNDEWAEAAKIDVNRVHDLEMEFLAAIDWKLLVDPLDFYEFLLGVETRIALSEGSKRGWFTYTDLSILMQHPAWYEACFGLLEGMLKVISICTLVYGFCAATTIWSALLLHQTSIPPQPANGCLPLPLGPHLAKSTETQHIYSHLLLDLVVRLYLEREPRIIAGSDPRVISGLRATPLETPSVHCSEPWYELEQQDLSRKGRLLSPSKESVSQETAVTDSCWSCLELQGPETEADRPQPSSEGRGKRCPCGRSRIQPYHSLVAKIAGLQETFLTFYGALLTAWSEMPSGMVVQSPHSALNQQSLSSRLAHPLATCRHCGRESVIHHNSSKSALVGHTSRKAKGKSAPSLLSSVSGLNLGFRTSSEILVTM